jgi:hypothetical protein
MNLTSMCTSEQSSLDPTTDECDSVMLSGWGTAMVGHDLLMVAHKDDSCVIIAFTTRSRREVFRDVQRAFKDTQIQDFHFGQ